MRSANWRKEHKVEETLHDDHDDDDCDDDNHDDESHDFMMMMACLHIFAMTKSHHGGKWEYVSNEHGGILQYNLLIFVTICYSLIQFVTICYNLL